MLADPHHSCIVLLNLTRDSAAVPSRASTARRGASLSLLPVCQELFAIPLIAIGEYEGALLPDQIKGAVRHLDLDALALWRDSRFRDLLLGADVGVIFLGGAFLDEEVLIVALEGARQGYDIRLLADMSIARLEEDRTLVLDRLACHGILATTLRQALLEWAVSLDDPIVAEKVRQVLS